MKIADPGLLQYADAFRIPRRISIPLIKDFEKWIKSSGEEWTVSRLKSIKLDFIKLKAGLEPEHSWVGYRQGSFRGSLGGLQKWSNFHWKRWSKAICLLQIYTTCISTKVTSSQEQKFLAGVSKPNTPIPRSYFQMVRRSAKVLGLDIPSIPLPRPLALEPTSSERYAPHASGKSYPESESVLEGLSFTRQTCFGWEMRDKYESIFNAVEEGIEVHDPRDWDLMDSSDYTDSVGRIGLIQEPGYKLRAVANPARVYQQALRPLGNALYHLLEHLPWDCTHQQDKAFPFIQESLKSERVVHSVDLTGATDYFPLDLQLHVLKTIVRRDIGYVNLFRDISRGDWFYNGTKKIRWTRGQPLGLHPSFASFALCHGLLLFALNNFEHKNAFFVLGDDVVILDLALYQAYVGALKDLECPISVTKSIVSSKLAEFAGKLITPNSIISQLKWRQVSDDSFLDIVRNIGSQGLFLLKPRQRKIAKALWEVPDFLGGLGFNPSGASLQSRIYNALVLFGKKKDTRGYLMGYTRLVNKRNYYDKSTFPSRVYFEILESDFDKKSLAHLLTFLPTLIKWYEISGENLYTVNPDLPILLDNWTSSRTSLLVKLERFLQL